MRTKKVEHGVEEGVKRIYCQRRFLRVGYYSCLPWEEMPLFCEKMMLPRRYLSTLVLLNYYGGCSSVLSTSATSLLENQRARSPRVVYILNRSSTKRVEPFDSFRLLTPLSIYRLGHNRAYWSSINVLVVGEDETLCVNNVACLYSPIRLYGARV